MLTTKPRRKSLSLLKIAQHWQSADGLPNAEFRTFGIGEPSCFRCGWLPPVPDATGYGPVEPPQAFENWTYDRRRAYSWQAAGRFLDIAHLVDWSATHDDGLHNVVPLCHYPCHKRMPAFLAGQRDEALAWVAEHPTMAVGWQVFTDAQAWYGVFTDRKDMQQLYVQCLELVASVKFDTGEGQRANG